MLDALSETFEANAILAGENVFEDMDYDDRCDTLARVMRSNYAYFDLPYNGYNRHGEEMPRHIGCWRRAPLLDAGRRRRG